MMAWSWRCGVMVLMAGATMPAAMADPAPPGGSAAPISLTALQQLEAGLWQLDVKGRAPARSASPIRSPWSRSSMTSPAARAS
ncbi:hypothetical protein ACFSTI_18455 [Rhizorhabdus histidinilytica]